MIQKKLSSLSKTEEIFEKIKIQYESALKNSGFKTSLSYVKDNIKKKESVLLQSTVQQLCYNRYRKRVAKNIYQVFSKNKHLRKNFQ